MAGIRLADLRGYSYDRRDVTARALANAYAQTLGIDLHRAAEALRGRALRGRGRRRPPATTSSTGSPTTARSSTSPDFLVMGGQAEAVADAGADVLPRRPAAGRARSASRCGRWARSAATAARRADAAGRRASRWRCSTATAGKRKFRRITGAALTSLLPARADPGRRRAGRGRRRAGAADDRPVRPRRPNLAPGSEPASWAQPATTFVPEILTATRQRPRPDR